MKRILFVTNYPPPYRVNFFDELGKHLDVTVLCSDRIEEKKHRNMEWFVKGQGNFRIVQLGKRIVQVKGRSLCLDVINWINQKFDSIIICGYSSPTAMLAITYLKLKRIPFYIEIDGGIIRSESNVKYQFKRQMLGSASGWFSSGKYPTEYLVHYGARRADVYEYPFSSLWEKDILSSAIDATDKKLKRETLGIKEQNVIIAVGQFVYRKGFDVLMKAACYIDKETGIYIVGGEPTVDYLKMKEELGLCNVHFVGFQKKDQLLEWYKASDLFVLPTREDIWGLVINEAMACGLPVVTTDKCVAGLELIENGVNGYIVPVNDDQELAEKMMTVLDGNFAGMGQAALERIRPYTLENMVKAHLNVLA